MYLYVYSSKHRKNKISYHSNNTRKWSLILCVIFPFLFTHKMYRFCIYVFYNYIRVLAGGTLFGWVGGCVTEWTVWWIHERMVLGFPSGCYGCWETHCGLPPGWGPDSLQSSARKPSDGSSQAGAEVQRRLKPKHRWTLGPWCRETGVEVAGTDFQDRGEILLSAAFVYSGPLMGCESPTK